MSAAETAVTPAPACAHAERHIDTSHLLHDLKARTVSSAFITTTAQIVLFAMTMATTMVMARLLPPADFGLVAMGLTAIGFLRNFKNAGLSSATVQRENITHAQVSNLFWINAGVSTAITLTLAAASPVVAWFFKDPRLRDITLWLSLTFLIEGLTVQHTALLNRQMRFAALAIVQVSAALTSTCVGVGMAVSGCGYWSLVGAQLASPALTLVLTYVISGWRPQRPRRRIGTRPLVSFGLNLTASSFLYSIASGMDSLLIGRFYGAGSVGLYSRAAAILRRPLDQFLTPINAVFIPVLSRVQGQPDRYRRTFLQILEAISLCVFAFAGLCGALSRQITVILLGPGWEGAAPIFAAFSLAAIVVPLCSACAWLFESQGRGRDSLVTSMISCSVTVGSFVVGLPFGAKGVALAYSLAGLLIQIPLYFHLAGRTGPVATPMLWRAALGHAPVWAISAFAGFATAYVLRGTSAWTQAVAATAAVVPACALFILIWSPSRRTAVVLLDAARAFAERRRNASHPV